MHQNLAKHYDQLVADQASTAMWVEYFKLNCRLGNVLELASGTGEITLALAEDFEIDATDISQEMLEVLRSKDSKQKINSYKVMDMTKITVEHKYDNVICFCDSINYILNLDDILHMFEQIYDILNDNGVFMFDIHSLGRLCEFSEDFLEAGQVNGIDYQWLITLDNDILYHQFVFYEEHEVIESFAQRIYDPEVIIDLLTSIGFKTNVHTDFTDIGINDGEKIFISAIKETI